MKTLRGLMAAVVVLAGSYAWADAPIVVRCDVPEPICPPPPVCCKDAKICIRVDNDTVCYTEKGLYAFVGLWREAAAKGIENATIRAFNATNVAPPCAPCEKLPNDKPTK